ncbi:TspO/MBR family protein [Sphingomonas sp. NPDC019816]|uniref:TspO/MBR family protein n=1 Tax=Sphingomonas sp. NPDC019816 TaxID=3390679 RepID=UPI003CFCA925
MDKERSGMSPWLAGGIAAGVLGLSALIGRRNAPDPSHPRIRQWYRGLDKPGFTPPAPVFGAVWPVLETLATFGGYRLLRQPASPRRNAAVALWLGNSAMIGGWTELFFRERRTDAGTVAAAAMTRWDGRTRGDGVARRSARRDQRDAAGRMAGLRDDAGRRGVAAQRSRPRTGRMTLSEVIFSMT